MRSGKYNPKKGEKGRINFLKKVRRRTVRFAQSNEVFRGMRNGNPCTLAYQYKITKEHGLGICVNAGLLIVDKTRKGSNGSVYVKWNRPLNEPIENAYSTYMISYNTRVSPRKAKSVEKLKAERLANEIKETVSETVKTTIKEVIEEEPKTNFPSSTVVSIDNSNMSDYLTPEVFSKMSLKEQTEYLYKCFYEDKLNSRVLEAERSKSKHKEFLLLKKIILNNTNEK